LESDVLLVTGGYWTKIENDKQAKASYLKATFFYLPGVPGQKSTSSLILQISLSALPPLTSNSQPKNSNTNFIKS